MRLSSRNAKRLTCVPVCARARDRRRLGLPAVRWLFASIAVVVVGCVAALAIYAWGLRSEAGNRSLAIADSEAALRGACQDSTERGCDRYRALKAEHVAARVWRVRLRKGDSGTPVCALIDLDRFEGSVGKSVSFAGITPVRC